MPANAPMPVPATPNRWIRRTDGPSMVSRTLPFGAGVVVVDIARNVSRRAAATSPRLDAGAARRAAVGGRGRDLHAGGADEQVERAPNVAALALRVGERRLDEEVDARGARCLELRAHDQRVAGEP